MAGGTVLSASGPASAGASSTGVVAGTPLSANQVAGIRKSAQEFEAMAVGEMLRPMFNTVDTSKGMFGGGQGEATWKPMMIDEMAKAMARHGGIGIADSVFKEMLRMQEARHDPMGRNQAGRNQVGHDQAGQKSGTGQK